MNSFRPWRVFLNRIFRRNDGWVTRPLRRSQRLVCDVERLEARIVLAVVQTDSSFGRQGVVTTDFTDSVTEGSVDQIRSIQTMSDGRFVAVSGNSGQIARYLADGTLDTTFGMNGLLYSHALGTINDVAVLSDGSLLLAGQLPVSTAQGDTQLDLAVVKLTATGSLDSSFGSQGAAVLDVGKRGFDDMAFAIRSLSDGSILVAGAAGNSAVGSEGAPGTSDFAVAKFQSNGSLDTNFGVNGSQVIVFPNASSTAHSVVVDGSGRIVLIGGARFTGGTNADFALTRLLATGAIDTSFAVGTNNRILTDFGLTKPDEATSGVVLSDGTIVAGGYTTRAQDEDFALAAYTPSGTLQTTFGAGGLALLDFSENPAAPSNDRIGQLALQSDGQIVAAGFAIQNPDTDPLQRLAFARFAANGSVDTTLNTARSGRLTGAFFQPQVDATTAIAITSIGNWLVGGVASNAPDFGLTRIQPNGQVDASFGAQGVVTTDFTAISDVGSVDQIRALALMSDGRIVAAGGDAGQVARYQPDGKLDTAWDSDGRSLVPQLQSINDVAVLANGSVLLVGQVFTEDGGGDFGVIKLQPNGALDTSFGTQGVASTDLAGLALDDVPYAIGVQNDGSLLVAGAAGKKGASGVAVSDFGIARFTPNGQIDQTFVQTGKRVIAFNAVSSQARDLLIDGAGGIILIGSAQLTGRSDSDFALTRLTANGQIDTQFGAAGTGLVTVDFGSQLNDEAVSGVLRSDGSIVIGGTSSRFKAGGTADKDFSLAAFDASGKSLTAFGTQGRMVVDFNLGTVISNDRLGQLALQSNGQVVAAGTASDTGPLGLRQRMELVRINLDGSVDTSTTTSNTGLIRTRFNLSSSDGATALAVQSDEKWVVGGFGNDGGNFQLIRLQSPSQTQTPPTVTLAVSPATLAEASGVSTVTAKLSAASTLDVTVALTFTGTAINGSDYSSSSVTIVIPAGSITGTITLTALQDAMDEPDENIVVDISNVTNGMEFGNQQVIATITDDDTGAPVNHPPIATGFSLTTNVGQTFSGVLTATDSEADPITFRIITQGLKGTASIFADGSFTYRPNSGASGTDSFTFQVNDGKADSNIAVVSVQINPAQPQNRPPVATAATFTITAGQELMGTLGGSDPDGDSLTYVVSQAPTKGTISLNPFGAFVYQPLAGVIGTDTFTFKVNDGTSDSSIAAVSIQINRANQPPVVTGTSLSTGQSQSIVGLLRGSDPEGDPLTYRIIDLPRQGTVNITNAATGRFSYRPNPGAVGTDSFTFAANDGQADSNPGVVTVSINSPPVAQSGMFNTQASQSIVGQLIASDLEFDRLSYSLATAARNGSVVVDSTTGSFTYTPNPEFSGVDSFTFTASDGTSTGIPATITVNVQPGLGFRFNGNIAINTKKATRLDPNASLVNVPAGIDLFLASITVNAGFINSTGINKDTLSIVKNGNISLSGKKILFAGQQIGSFFGGTYGSLSISLFTNDLSAINALLGSIGIKAKSVKRGVVQPDRVIQVAMSIAGGPSVDPAQIVGLVF